MKKTAILGLMFVYLLSAIGVTATSFYCCGFLRSTSFSVVGSGVSQVNSESATNKCCKTTKHQFKVKDNHFVSTFFFAKVKVSPSVISFTPLNNLNLVEAKDYSFENSHAPPLWRHTPIYTLTRNYRI